jgi:prophage regulatory protein
MSELLEQQKRFAEQQKLGPKPIGPGKRARGKRKHRREIDVTTSQETQEADVKVELPQSVVFLSKAQVLKKIPVTAATLWAWVRQGKFPRPRTISPFKTVWIAAEVEAWMLSRPLITYKKWEGA